MGEVSASCEYAWKINLEKGMGRIKQKEKKEKKKMRLPLALSLLSVQLTQ